MHRKLNNKNLLNFAKNNRRSLTPAETKLWNILRDSKLEGCKFRRQETISNYIVDFICYEKSLIIEIDGGQHNKKTNELFDKERTGYLNNQGFKVLRFWNNEILENIEGVYNIIVNTIKETKPSPANHSD
jgi:very-short-patch-repair endonuclease